METYTIKDTRRITSEEQHVCDVCQEPATTGCRDAIETREGWMQSAARYGCPAHPVTPNVKRFADGGLVSGTTLVGEGLRI